MRQVELDPNPGLVYPIGAYYFTGQRLSVLAKIDAALAATGIEHRVNHGHGPDAPQTCLERGGEGRITDGLGLQFEEAADDLEVIIDAMMHFLKKDALVTHGV